MELRDKRTLTSKIFARPDGLVEGKFSGAHLHYNSKLDGTGIREIDFTLQWDDIKRGWFFTYHSFHPFLPEYADEWVEFRDLFDDKDQTIKYRAHAQHILGRLTDTYLIGIEKVEGYGVNCVIYDDAFGKGMDYILYFDRHGLKKVARIRDGFKPSNDALFTWDVEFPKAGMQPMPVYRTDSKQAMSSGYTLDTSKDKIFDTSKQTLVGLDGGNGKEWYTYLRSFKVWDSSSPDRIQKETVTVDYSSVDNSITKIVPLSFLEKSIGDVYTDTTTSYFAGAGDGKTGRDSTGGTWVTTYVDGTALDADYVTSTLANIADNNGAQYRWYHTFYPIDTSAIGAGSTITAAAMHLNKASGASGMNDTGYITRAAQASTTEIVVGDHTLWTKTAISSNGISNDDADGGYNLTITDFTAISQSGFTKLGFNFNRGITGSAPTTFQCFISMRMSEDVTDPPYLSVTFTGAIVAAGTLLLLGV